MNIPPLHPKIQAADVPLEQLAGNQKISDPDKVAEVSRQFEAVLLRQILQAARKSTVASSSSADAMTSGIYDDMINNQLAESISRSGSFGLAKSLQSQLAHQVLPNLEAVPSSPARTPAPLGKTSSK
ncbi:MAG: rod-binding protein [Verrucomicrobiota bacterium]|jgi:Rod binding domain-containing protein